MRFLPALLLVGWLLPGVADANGLALADTVQTQTGWWDHQSHGSNDWMAKELQYQAEKKDVGMAVLFGLLLPGAGNYYAGDILGGSFLLAATITGLVLYASDDVDTSNIGGAMVVGAVIASPISAGMEVSSRNKKLRKKLGLSLRLNHHEPQLAVSVHF